MKRISPLALRLLLTCRPLIDTSMSQTMTKALVSAMGVMTDSLSQTFAQALLQAQRSAHPSNLQVMPLSTPAQSQSGHKAVCKTKHSSQSIEMDSSEPVTDGVINLPPRKRATSQAKSARLWKRAKAQLDSESELSDIEEESYRDDSDDGSDPGSDAYDEETDPSQDTIPLKRW
ncbi:Hypothetical predicted protein [Pelobates cultripes]|uniref:Uncharacterized protein n=1 Tax=Pelobates cultripes TaxID=61616 RepID=A0AAD1SC85_PELCU|nr:Hypothetical predicted protein [Pelobates cultripes]